MAATAALSRSAIIAVPISPAAVSVRPGRRTNLSVSARPVNFGRKAAAKIQSSPAQEAISDLLSEVPEHNSNAAKLRF